MHYRRIVRRVLVPALGGVELTRLQPSQMQALYTRLFTRARDDGTGGLAANSVLHIHHVLHAAVRQRARWQLLARNH